IMRMEMQVSGKHPTHVYYCLSEVRNLFPRCKDLGLPTLLRKQDLPSLTEGWHILLHEVSPCRQRKVECEPPIAQSVFSKFWKTDFQTLALHNESGHEKAGTGTSRKEKEP